MTWVRYEQRFSNDKDKIIIRGGHVSIGWTAFQKLGKPDRVEVYYDKEMKAIKLETSKDGRKITAHGKSGKYHSFSCTVSKIMPHGNYYRNEENIFVYKEIV